MTRILLYCLGLVTLVGVVMGSGAVLAGEVLLGVYSSDPEVIRFGMYRLAIIGSTYFICGWMETMVGGLRGMGYSVVPMLVSLTGACAFRIIWLFTVFAMNRSLEVLYWSYPVSWGITVAAHVVTYVVVRQRMAKKQSCQIAN